VSVRILISLDVNASTVHGSSSTAAILEYLVIVQFGPILRATVDVMYWQDNRARRLQLEYGEKKGMDATSKSLPVDLKESK
jgi:hypothetical protein